MRPPLEYGDNFPVPASSAWDPTVPWRFPRHKVQLQRPPFSSRALPWIMLGVGLALGFGILWIGLHLSGGPLTGGRNEILGRMSADPATGRVAQPTLQVPTTPLKRASPEGRPVKAKSRLV